MLLLDVTERDVDGLLKERQLVKASERAKLCRDYLNQITKYRLEGGSQAGPLADVDEADHRLEKVMQTVQENAISSAKEKIAHAEQVSDEAHCWYWFNDRNKVRQGLCELRQVHELFELLDADTRGEYFQALDMLKRRVSNADWDKLFAEAGWFAKNSESSKES